MQTEINVDAEFLALTRAMNDSADPTDLPEWLTDDEPQPTDLPPRRVHRPRHQRCPWVGLAVPKPATHPAVEAAAISSGLEAPAMPYLGGRAHDGTAIAMVDHAAAEITAMLVGRNVSRRRLRALLETLEAMN